MDRYMRAYRDLKSPLTPLTPLGAISAFTFNINDATPKQTATPTNTPIASAQEHMQVAAQRFSSDFQRLRSVFEKPRQSCKCAAKKSLKKQQQKPQQQQHKHTQNESEEDAVETHEEDGTKIANNNDNNNNIFLKIPEHINARKQTTTTTATTPKKSCASVSANQKQTKQTNCVFRKASPIAQKPLSPRISSLLEQAGISKLKGLFQREEIDSAVLRLMKPEDLKYLGIEDKDDIRRIRGLITGAWNLFRSAQN